MPRSDWLTDIRTAVAFLTRLPVGGADSSLTQACWAFPLAGVLVGLVGGGVYAACFALTVPPAAAALLAIAATAAVTGALHEDGLADTVDGFGGGDTPERKLQIMRDSRIGAFGVLALIFSVALRAAALTAIADWGAVLAAMMAAAALSRGLLPGMMRLVPLASEKGLAAAAGIPEKGTAIIAAALGVLVMAVLFSPVSGIGVTIIAIGGVGAVGALARRQIGGYNGDTLGAAQQVSETGILVAIAALS